MIQAGFDTAESWSVTYRSLVYDNAGRLDGVWWYRDPVTKAILRFVFQDWVMPRQKNDT
jgi:hypothetical protein